MSNLSVLQKLPQVSRVSGVYATLARLDGKSAWQFLTMPGEINFNRGVSYSASNAPGGTVPSNQWGYTEGWQMSISALPLSGLWANKSLDSYVDAIAALQIPEKPNPPPILVFSWGQKLFSPAFMSNFSRVEKLWFPGGELAECTISFTLLEANERQIITA